MEITFLRHGATSSNEQKHFCGVSNPSLSIAGQQQAEHAADLLRNHKIDVFLCGPSKRTLQTAKIVMDHLLYTGRAYIDPRIREIDFGEFENLSFDEIEWKYPALANRYLNNWLDFTFPSGDNAREYFERCGSVIDEIIAQYAEQNICIVAHKGFINACLCRLEHKDQQDMFSYELACGEAKTVHVSCRQKEE